ncbi:MAG: cyclic pyranopterin monophosphate synthase MoaC [Deltaproteobacteria bacterium]|jgi:cyclic pyranopterin phosphate synthase|nr:cyclic pyranopterin monophosphate synthase MoaC [Deltaproteobacteria bacterium]
MSNSPLSHVDAQGKVKMVDVAAKNDTMREAVASGTVIMQRETAALISGGAIAKGDVINTATIAGIIAAKKVADLIPLCHSLSLSSVDIVIDVCAREGVAHIKATAKSFGKTGVEMEALTAVAVAGLTLYDMCKAVDKGMVIGEIKLLEKRGGKSGTYTRKEGS